MPSAVLNSETLKEASYVKGFKLNPQSAGGGRYVNSHFYDRNMQKFGVNAEAGNNYMVRKNLGRLPRRGSIFFQEEFIEERHSGRENAVSMRSPKSQRVGV